MQTPSKRAWSASCNEARKSFNLVWAAEARGCANNDELPAEGTDGAFWFTPFSMSDRDRPTLDGWVWSVEAAE
jgi:hypothetical protein